MARTIYEGYVFEVDTGSGFEYYLSPNRDTMSTTLIGTDGVRYSPTEIAASIDRDADEWGQYVTPLLISESEPHLAAFRGKPIEEFLKLVFQQLRVECPGCHTRLVDSSTVKKVIHEQGIDVLKNAVGGAFTGSATVVITLIILEALDQLWHIDDIAAMTHLTRKEGGASAEKWACEHCGATVYP